MDPGEKRTFEMAGALGGDSDRDNLFLRLFRELHFYDAESDTPYRSYVYWPRRVIRDPPDANPAVDEAILYERSDGSMDRLFVRSPERPFYLERDKEDGDLGRLVITFVPSTDATAGGAGQ